MVQLGSLTVWLTLVLSTERGPGARKLAVITRHSDTRTLHGGTKLDPFIKHPNPSALVQITL